MGYQLVSLWTMKLGLVACLAAQNCFATPCATETLSSVFLSSAVPVDLFSNPNGNALTIEEIDEVRASIAKIRLSLGAISSMARTGSPFLESSLDVTVGANSRATGYSFSPRSFRADTAKAGQVLITFATAPRAEMCKIFWVRVSLAADKSNRGAAGSRQML